MPVVVEAVRHVELEAGRVRQHHAAAGVHRVDLLADVQGVLDVQQPERVFVGDEQDAFALTHARYTSNLLFVHDEIEMLAGRRVDFENLERLIA